jgi:hypothetical protein
MMEGFEVRKMHSRPKAAASASVGLGLQAGFQAWKPIINLLRDPIAALRGALHSDRAEGF